MKTLLIKNGNVVTASDRYTADIYIEGETVHTIGKNLSHQADQVIDASGCYVFPGGIDAHTHMDMPFMGTSSSDTFESGTLAGLHGGTTTIIDFAMQKHGDTLNAALNQWNEKAAGKSVGDYAFHVAVTDFSETARSEIGDLVKNKGVSSFKIFMAYKGALMVDDRQSMELMEEVKKFDGMVIAHCENGDVIDHLITENLKQGNTAIKYHALSRPTAVEAEASGRIMDIAQAGGHPLYIVHMTCEEALDRVRDATKRNQKVWVETCVQYLLLDDAVYYEEGFEGSKWVMSPPLRSKKDQKALWAGINQNLIHTVATDHCPFCMEQKKAGLNDFSKIPNGAPGVEHRMELMYSEGVAQNRISLEKFVEVTATAPAKIFGLFPRKGTIAVGSDADIVIFDPSVEHTLSAKTHHMNCDYSAYEGWKVIGKVKSTILRGTLAIDQGHALVGKGFGKYLPRGPSGRL
ncbi:MAG: dihydropyrimidinase [Bdellovibrionales bacterium]|nr:dihydropyrimidinase [Oligoflexia bacterium]